jgi:hypothetical protein
MRFFKKKPKQKYPRSGDEYHRRYEREIWAKQIRIGTINNWIAGIGLLFSLIAAGGAVAAVFYAKGAYIAANDQANADWNSATQAKRQADAASQPYIFVGETAGNSIDSWLFDGASFMDVKISAKNFGAAPAIVSYVGCFLIWGTKQAPPPTSVVISNNDYSIILDDNASFPIVIGSNGAITGDCESPWPINDDPPSGQAQVTQYRINRVFNGAIWVVGIVDYTDVNGTADHTAFCAKSDDGADVTPGGDAQCQQRD